MNILLVSQCEKKALTETRRVLDQFAERRGNRTWQTAITQEGLKTLHRLLKKRARKNTAVACHWIRSKNHSELLWVVGNQQQFNDQGATPTNTTRRNIRRSNDENNWRYGETIQLISALSALFHDLGKACFAFQLRLHGKISGKNLLRHEWISIRLLQAFINQAKNDEEWLSKLCNSQYLDSQYWLNLLEKSHIRDCLDSGASSNKPFSDREMPPLAQAIAWLIVSHHRLLKPLNIDKLDNITNYANHEWNDFLNGYQPDAKDKQNTIDNYWEFKNGLPISSLLWQKEVGRLAKRLLEKIHLESNQNWLHQPYLMHVSRLVLMLADHHYSSLTEPNDRLRGFKSHPLFANTLKSGEMNQTLDEHLVGVAKHSQFVSWSLPRFHEFLPYLQSNNATALRKRTKNKRFIWQDKAFDLAKSLQQVTEEQGAFIVNMASTGCGKTLGNARIMYALSNPKLGMRCAFALGLRTLTLQTGQAFRNDLNLNEEQVAILVGGSANKELFDFYEAKAEASGSASTQALLDEENEFSGAFCDNNEFDFHPLLQRLTKDKKVRTLLSAPILVSTIDHLIPASEGDRGGKQISPMLRLMSSDLVLDEPDDFDLDDDPALVRLVYFAGLLGSRVLLSSATLPSSLIQVLFEAYLKGRQDFESSRTDIKNPSNISCIWVDENQQTHQSCQDNTVFEQAHKHFVEQRCQWLESQAPRRTLDLLPIQTPEYKKINEKPFYDSIASQLVTAMLSLHHHNHQVDPHSQKEVSFGLVRFANIDPLFQTALSLYQQNLPEDIHIHLCVYHSQYPLFLRSAIEYQLDQSLQRKDPLNVFDLVEIRQKIDQYPAKKHLFVVLGSPVTEVGRDHDYDWAIVEPSSIRSMIQLIGRIRRHRPDPYDSVNVLLLDQNIKGLKKATGDIFSRPGYENKKLLEFLSVYSSHIRDILRPEEYRHLDARLRIKDVLYTDREELKAMDSLVRLEHARMYYQLLGRFPLINKYLNRRLDAPYDATLPANKFLDSDGVMLTAYLQNLQKFRKASHAPETEVVFKIEDDTYLLYKKATDYQKNQSDTCIEDAQLERIPDTDLLNPSLSAWSPNDFLETLSNLAQALDKPINLCAEIYGRTTLRHSGINGWRFHTVLGFNKAQ